MTPTDWQSGPSHLSVEYDDDGFWTAICGEPHPEHLTYVASIFVDYVNACPDCLAHPDLPMHLLGDLL